MGTTNARQHFLPASYLARFSSEPARGREAPIYRLGDDGKFVVTSCESQCAKRYFYSADTKREGEEWEALEGSWRKLVDDVEAATAEGNLVGRLFEQLTTLHLRNAAFEHAADEQDGERLDTLLTARRQLWFTICGQPDKGLFALPPTWRAHVLRLEDPAFVVSDNPVVMFAHTERQKYSCLGAPLTPRVWAFVYDVDKWGLFPEGDIVENGEAVWSLLNQVQCAASVRAIYAHCVFPEPELSKYRTLFKHRLGGRAYGSGGASFVMMNFPSHPVFPPQV